MGEWRDEGAGESGVHSSENVTGDDESFKELNSSIEAFERAVRARPQPKVPDPGPQPQGPDRRFRWHAFLRPVVIAGLALLAAMLYFGRGERVEPQRQSVDGAGPAAVVNVPSDPSGPSAAPLVTTGEREQVARDALPTPTEADGSVESVGSRTANRSDTTDRDRGVAPGTDDAVDAAAAAVTLNGSNRPVERDERQVETGTAAPARRDGDYAVQVVAYDRRSQATAFADRLVDAGYPAYVVEARLGADRAVFRVWIGAYPDRRAAELVGQRVQEEAGLDWYLVRLR